MKNRKMEFLLIPLIQLLTFISVAFAQGDYSEPLILTVERDAHPENYIQLPFRSIPTPWDKAVITACPAEEEEDKLRLSNAAEKSPQMKNCLYEKKFSMQQNIGCKAEVKPVIREIFDDQTKVQKICGQESNHKYFEFGFYYCGNIERLKLLDSKRTKKYFQFDAKFLPLYELCIKTSKSRAVWTKHNIRTPTMFRNPSNTDNLHKESVQQELLPIRTDALDYKEKTFMERKKEYNNQRHKKFHMNPNLLVPKEHIALRMWKQVINHQVIVVPLWDKLQKLMDGINDMIKKLALKYYDDNGLLTVYTKVEYLPWRHQHGRHTISKGKNIWYKLLYEVENKLAILIVLYNTPEAPPDLSKNICKTYLSCNMASWYQPTEQEPNIQPEDQSTKYGFCCDPHKDEIIKLFNESLDISGSLNIDLVLNQYNIQMKALKNMPENSTPNPGKSVKFKDVIQPQEASQSTGLYPPIEEVNQQFVPTK